MALFRRKRAASQTDAEPGVETTTETETGPASEREGAGDAQAAKSGSPAAAGDSSGEPSPPSPAEPGVGPFDVTDLPSREGLVDLGAILLPGIQGLVMSMEMDQSTGDVTAVRIHLGESQLQLQAFAAPRSAGIWDEIRTEIAQALGAQGGSSTQEDGPFGTELIVRVPGRDPDARSMTSAMRFLGVDRPRWFLRGVISGPAATDPQAAQPFIELMQVTVIDRGSEPMAPRELLPLRLPPEAPGSHESGQAGSTEQAGQAEQQDHGDPDAADAGQESDRDVSTDDLRPFERGPEITEIR